MRGTGATCEKIPDAETRESDRRHTSSSSPHFSTCSARSKEKFHRAHMRGRGRCAHSRLARQIYRRCTAMVRARRGPAVPRSTAKLEDSEPGEAELSIPSTWREDISTAVASTSTDPVRAEDRRRVGTPTRFQKPLTRARALFPDRSPQPDVPSPPLFPRAQRPKLRHRRRGMPDRGRRLGVRFGRLGVGRPEPVAFPAPRGARHARRAPRERTQREFPRGRRRRGRRRRRPPGVRPPPHPLPPPRGPRLVPARFLAPPGAHRRELERHRIHPRRLVRSIRRHRLVRLPRGAVRVEPPPRRHRPAQTRPRDGNLGLSAVRRVSTPRTRRSSPGPSTGARHAFDLGADDEGADLSAREAARATLPHREPVTQVAAGRETSRRRRAGERARRARRRLRRSRRTRVRLERSKDGAPDVRVRDASPASHHGEDDHWGVSSAAFGVGGEGEDENEDDANRNAADTSAFHTPDGAPCFDAWRRARPPRRRNSGDGARRTRWGRCTPR